jgi:hypothetical protein
MNRYMYLTGRVNIRSIEVRSPPARPPARPPASLGAVGADLPRPALPRPRR